MKEIDIKLYDYIRHNSFKMPHDDLYYLLLDWADQHQEIQDELVNLNDRYQVCYIDSFTGKSEQIIFTSENGKNPYAEARKFYREILGMVDCAELWRLANPYLPGKSRRGELIMSFEIERR